MNSQAPQEGASHSRPPLFDESNYAYWKARMNVHLSSLGVRVLRSVQYGYEIPMIEDASTKQLRVKTDSEWNTSDRESFDANSRVVNAIYCALTVPEFNRISSYTTAKEVWDVL